MMDFFVNIFAFSFPVFVFLYFTLVGYAAISILRTNINSLQNLLVAPAIGIAFTLLPIFWLNRAGIPVKNFALILTIIMGFLSVAILIRKKTPLPYEKYTPFFLLFILALFLTGRPLLRFGFDWISFANDDMANYCLGALRFIHHGYSDQPILSELIKGKDYSQYYWFMFIARMSRSGSELLLAWLSVITGMNPLKIFMPLILTFHLALISTAGALVLISKRWYSIAFIACVFLTFSALTTLGTLYQLIGQVGGITLLIATCLLLFETLNIKKNILKYAILLSLTASALLIFYPEVSPILGLGFFIYLAISIVKAHLPTKKFLTLMILSALMSFIFLNVYWVNVLLYLHFQSTTALTLGKGTLFPYFLVPSGLADLWGLQRLATLPGDPWLSISILISILLCLLTIYLILNQLKKRYPFSIISFAMILLSAYLYIKLGNQSGFSLFKLSMYFQPFFLGVLATGIFEKIRSQNLKWISCGLLIGFGALSQYCYLQDSYGKIGKPFNELPEASYTHLSSELLETDKGIPDNIRIISDTANVVYAKLQALTLFHKSILFSSTPFFHDLAYESLPLSNKIFPDNYSTGCKIKSKIEKSEKQKHFSIETATHKNLSTTFVSPPKIKNDDFLLMASPLRSIFNRRYFSFTYLHNSRFEPASQVSNHLIFINSSLGQFYYGGESEFITLNNLEKDYFFRKNSMAGVGRYLLLEIIHPTNKYRLEVSLTETLSNDRDNKLPPIQIIGKKHYPLSLPGRGSAHVFSDFFVPKIVDGMPYFLLDFGKQGKSFSTSYKGLMKLFGTDIPLDTRLLVGFARNISLISEEEYQNIKAPILLSTFPSDLNNPNLEYSGIYEDGWFSEDVYLKLSKPNDKSKLIIDGMFPNFQKQIPFTLLTVYVNNQKITERKIEPGYFQFKINIPGKNDKKNIRLHFSRYFFLPTGDGRPATVKINQIGFKIV